MKKTAILALCLFAIPAMAVQTVTYGWEDGGTILGNYGDINASNVTTPVYNGSYALELEDAAASGTPQAYVAWINGLTDGDIVTASFYCYDTTPGGSPSARIWGHYTGDATDIDDYAGSASGSYDYPAGDGWSELSFTWTFDSDGGTRDGLVVEVRTYSSAGDTVWVDDLSVTAPNCAAITTPCVPEPATLALLAIGGLAIIRRR